MQPTILIIHHNEKNFLKPPYSKDEVRRKNYEFVGKFFLKRDCILARSSIHQYIGKGVFSSAWIYEKDGWKRKVHFKPDVVICKTHASLIKKVHKEVGRYLPVINPPEVEFTCRSKIKTMQTFPGITIKGFLVNNVSQMKAAAKKLPGDKVVLKPNSESSGRGITVHLKSELPKTIEKNMLVQEYFDGSGGVPGVTKGVSDLRLIIANGKIVVVFTRIAKDGFFTNQSKKGTLRILTVKDVPKKAFSTVKKVEAKFKKYGPRIYTIDLMFDPKGNPRIMELNASPSFNYQAINRLDQLQNILEELIRGAKTLVRK